MKDQEKSKEQLLDELTQMSQRIAQLEESETRRKEVETALQESEQRFRQVAETSGEFIWEVDINGLYTYANPVVEEILGYKPEEIVGKKYFYDFFIPDIRDALKKAAFEVFAGKAVFRNFVNPNVRKNGTIVILETSGLPVMDKQGNLIGYRGADRDITARKKAEETLRVSEERYKSMVNAVTMYTYSVYLGQEGTISTKHSIGCIPITGYNPEEYESDPYLWHNMIYPDDKLMIENTIKEIMAGHKVPPIEHRLIRRDGIVVWVRNTLVPYYDLFGRLVQYDGLIEDITERKIAEDKIMKLNEELEKKVAELTEANKELEAFNRTVSHDLQTPLTLIGGFTSRYLKIYGDILDTYEIDMTCNGY